MEKIVSLTRLKQLADEKKSVICPESGALAKARPAAFVMNMSGTIIQTFFERGLFVYAPKGKQKAQKEINYEANIGDPRNLGAI